MSVKTTGIEFKQFYNDPKFWPEGAWHDDELITIDGVEAGCDVDLSKVEDGAKLVIEGGAVLTKDNDQVNSLEGYFKKWRKEQSTVTMVVTVDKSKEDAVVEAIKAAGGKIV